MITRTFKVTHVSFFGFDGKSKLWEDFPFTDIVRDPESGSYRPARLRGSVYHYKPRSFEMETEITVTSDFILGKEAIVEYQNKRYVASVNFGFDRSVLAFSVRGPEGGPISDCIFSNSVKLYTAEPTTEDFLAEKPLYGG